MKSFFLLVCIGIILSLTLVSGCIQPSKSVRPDMNTYQTTAMPEQIQTILLQPTIINYQGKPGWVKYSNYEDHFSVYKPSDWTINVFDKSDKIFGFEQSGMDISRMMDKVVAILTPDRKGFLMIYGMDFSGTLLSIFDDPNKTQISDELYNEFVRGIKSGETDNVKFTSLIKDSNYYRINGNPARHVKVISQMGGQTLNGDFYLIAHENTYYVEGYFATAGSTQSDASTASEIMRTFVITS